MKGRRIRIWASSHAPIGKRAPDIDVPTAPPFLGLDHISVGV
jgi:hypothetical protein